MCYCLTIKSWHDAMQSRFPSMCDSSLCLDLKRVVWPLILSDFIYFGQGFDHQYQTDDMTLGPLLVHQHFRCSLKVSEPLTSCMSGWHLPDTTTSSLRSLTRLGLVQLMCCPQLHCPQQCLSPHWNFKPNTWNKICLLNSQPLWPGDACVGSFFNHPDDVALTLRRPGWLAVAQWYNIFILFLIN